MSIKEEEMDSQMWKIFERLNLNSYSTEMHNLPLNELKSSLASLGQFVIVGKFDRDQDGDSPEQEKVNKTEEAAAEDKEGATSESDAVSQVNARRTKNNSALRVLNNNGVY